MATIKSYTDLEQSKRLAEILPIESADMCYQKVHAKQEYFDIAINVPPENQNDLPCWSLTALLSVIPKPDLVQNSEGTWLLHSWVNDYPWSVGGYSNPVDACVDVIIKLHEQNLL